MSNRFKASLFMVVVVAAVGGLLWMRYRPEGYRYDFTITSRTTAPGAAASELRWEGYGLERRQEVFNVDFNDGALNLTRSAVVPLMDSAGGFTSLHRKNSHSRIGDGGNIAGRNTQIHRYVDYDTLFLTDSGGRRMAHANKVVTDYYVAEDVGDVGRRFARVADSLNLVFAGLQPHQARERVNTRLSTVGGTPLRIVSQVSWVDGAGKTRETITESVVTKFDRVAVSKRAIRDLDRAEAATHVAARQNGWEYEFRIRTEGGEAKGDAPVMGKAEVIGRQMRITIEPREDERRDRERRGEYLLVSDEGRQIAMVRPNKKEFNVVSADSIARLVSVGLNAVSRFVEIKVSGLEIGSSKLGPGETIAGYVTERHRMTQAYRIDMKVFGAHPTLRGKLTTDFWVSPELQVPGNPMFDFFALLPNALALQSPDYVRQSVAERLKMFETLPLKTVATLETVDQEGKTSKSVSTIEVTSVKKATLNPDRFEIPSRYKATKGSNISF